jgi:hypothetical protein
LVVLDRLVQVGVGIVVVLAIVVRHLDMRCSVVDLEEVVMYSGLQSMGLLIAESKRRHYKVHLDVAADSLVSHTLKWQAPVD